MGNKQSFYNNDLLQTLQDLPFSRIDQVIQKLTKAKITHQKVFIIGNGGSATTAIHFACDLSKNITPPCLRAISLVDNVASLSAYANDDGFEKIFSDQLKVFADPGDLLIAITTSGRSKNILDALVVAREIKMQTIVFTSNLGYQIENMVDICVLVKTNDIRQAEDAHFMILHQIVSEL